MNIVITGLMGHGTLQAKIEPLLRIEDVETIYFLRKSAGPRAAKVNYVMLPSLCKYKFFNILLTPLLLTKLIFLRKPLLILGYHIFPYAYFAAFAGIITSTPYIISQTGLLVQQQSSTWFIKRTLHFIFKKSLQVNCPGNNSIKFWSSLFPDIRDKFKLLHSTVDTGRYCPNLTVRKEYDFIYLGRLHSIKNIDLIIEAFKLLLQQNEFEIINLIIAGSGPEKNNLMNLVDKLKLHDKVIFKDFVEDPVPLLQKSRFLIMASSSEGLPTSMMQAMSCGVIPITNLVGNISDIVLDNETGFPFHSQNKKSLSDAMQKALNTSGEKINQMQESCRKIITENHSHDISEVKWKMLLSKRFDPASPVFYGGT